MTKNDTASRKDTVPASGIFGRRCAVPTDLGTHKDASEGAKALFGRKNAEAA